MTKKRTFGTTAKAIAKDPGPFVIRVAKGFRANQGFLLAGAVAYYTLLSLVPLTILVLIGLSNFVEEAELLRMTNRYLELIGQRDGPMQLQGVWVRPGDWLLADADGIVPPG